MITITIVISVLVLVSSCLFHYIETICVDADDGAGDMPFHLALYYITIEVLGRPRIPVATWLGATVLIVLVIVVVVLIPAQLVHLFEALQRDSIYRRQAYIPRRDFSHVVVLGHVTYSNLHAFVFDFFAEDHGKAPREQHANPRLGPGSELRASRSEVHGHATSSALGRRCALTSWCSLPRSRATRSARSSRTRA